ncbi:MAG: hypothetical protein U0736_15135 [Gemmataceae bacterium]
MPLTHETARSLLARLAAGEIPAVALAEQFLAAIRRREPAVRASSTSMSRARSTRPRRSTPAVVAARPLGARLTCRSPSRTSSAPVASQPPAPARF